MKFITKRIRAHQAKRFIRNDSSLKLLDIGCGDRHLIEKFSKLRAEGMDLLYGQDAEKGLDYDNDTFDYITMLAVIEHFNDYKKVLEDCRRILKRGGLLIITTPKKSIEKFMRKEEIEQHNRYFIKTDFENMDGFRLMYYSTFELGLNQLIVLKEK